MTTIYKSVGYLVYWGISYFSKVFWKIVCIFTCLLLFIILKMFFQNVVYWSEIRFDEGGRTVVSSCEVGKSEPKDWTPAGFSARTTVHEYGGLHYLCYPKNIIIYCTFLLIHILLYALV
ncbi:hypothetical protein EB796_002866 [Bugula neritina]|uniref:Uncharacterized protein n=1 Tax=Bugula neritina TaxID=10212 RepID=A0A7J7KLL7_BUGNE|nr:hypothetical protein EB796_002866 [Bugula neritina]